jgi:hypothetical protein
MANVFVGIVEGPEPGTVTVGIADEQDGSVKGWSAAIEKTRLGDYYAPLPDGRMSFQLSPDIDQLGRFLQKDIGQGSEARFLVEVPAALPHPVDDAGGIPHPILTTDSVILKVLIFLNASGYIAAPFRVDEERELAAVFPIPPESLAHLRSITPRYLRQGISKAYGELLSLACELPEHVAIVGALIAKNAGAFHYWSSIGRVQSSQDVVHDLRSGRGTEVISAKEDYILEFTGGTRRDAIEDVPLEYALAAKRYEHLGPNDSIKAALIHVCKTWGITLRCISWRDDADAPNEPGHVYPLGTFESIVLGALQHAEEAGIWPQG